MSLKTDIARTDSTQAMQNLFSAYADDEEVAETGGAEEETEPHFSGSEDEDTPQPVDKAEKRPVIDLDLEEEIKKPKILHKRKLIWLY